MPTPPRPRRAAGAILTLSILAGAFGGQLAGQATIGFLAGLAIGIVALLLVWLADRRA